MAEQQKIAQSTTEVPAESSQSSTNQPPPQLQIIPKLDWDKLIIKKSGMGLTVNQITIVVITVIIVAVILLIRFILGLAPDILGLATITRRLTEVLAVAAALWGLIRIYSIQRSRSSAMYVIESPRIEKLGENMKDLPPKLITQTGGLWKRIQVSLLDKYQLVEVVQMPWQRMFKYGDLILLPNPGDKQTTPMRMSHIAEPTKVLMKIQSALDLSQLKTEKKPPEQSGKAK
jgi:hypothetical protein